MGFLPEKTIVKAAALVRQSGAGAVTKRDARGRGSVRGEKNGLAGA